jgi:hypothetical protein
MPETFSPAWEFYQADPEVEEILRQNRRGVADRLPQWDRGACPYVIRAPADVQAWSDYELLAIAYAYALGMSSAAIGARMNVTPPTVRRALRIAG